MLVDTHTHFYDEWLLPDAEAAIQRALDAGVGKMIQADVDSRERPAMWEIGRRHPGVLFQMAGFYPGSVTADNWKNELDLIHSIVMDGDITPPSAKKKADAPGGVISPATENKVDARSEPGMTEKGTGMAEIVAIGEIGLDYHEGKEYVKEQKEVLRAQLELAAAKDLPVNIHLRDAWEDLLSIFKDCKHLNLRGNLHCFSGSYEVYRQANLYGEWSVGIGGVVTFKNSGLAKTLQDIPMERILLETDAPYLAPVPHRGERNESAFLPLVAAKVAEIKGISMEEVENITTQNAEKLFNI